MKKKINWRIFIPYLYLHLDVGIFRFQTVLMHRALERDVYDIIRIEWSILKASGGFDLYKPGYVMFAGRRGGR